ncbi:MAG: hypothetical protein JL56_10650 [Desulfotomaculum sp. BICA1-6]|nr:MAG: hypothetical protein VR67_06815 [Peptococcaceae bacterium BRH_c8a]KJS73554.1 MAG: hypothetical protein JL56_10650 [Desulfotomaculum sp. BICA1-6]
MPGTFKVISPGLLTTVQDLGRFGFQQYGMTPAGAMDPFALQVGNLLLGNDIAEAAFEINYLGPVMEVLKDALIVVSGGNLSPVIDGNPLPMWEVACIRKGQVLGFGKIKNGCRAYVAVAGGIDVPVIMGSKSTFLRGKMGGFKGRQLLPGDILSTSSINANIWKRMGQRLPARLIPNYDVIEPIRVVMGPQDNYFTATALNTFLTSKYTVGMESDRMGYRMEGPKLMHKNTADIISDGVPLGAIQVPGSGTPIILMADRQTTGGYTKIATVISIDIPALAQLKPGNSIYFNRITVDKAQQLWRQQQVVFEELKSSCVTK